MWRFLIRVFPTVTTKSGLGIEVLDHLVGVHGDEHMPDVGLKK